VGIKLTKLVYVRRVAASVGIITHHAFIGMHSFTRCNAVFVGKGKEFALNLRTGSADLLELPSSLDRDNCRFDGKISIHAPSILLKSIVNLR
jgi:hypothetical protein